MAFSEEDIFEYQTNSVLAWINDFLFQSKNVKQNLQNFDIKKNDTRCILRCSIYHWLVSGNKILMTLERQNLEQFIVSAIDADLMQLLKDLRSVRAMWEHDFVHLDGNGNYQRRFLLPLDLRKAGLDEKQMIAGTQLIVEAGRLKIGGRLDFELVVGAVESFEDRLYEKWQLQEAGIEH